MRRPYRERLRIILDELGAGVGGRSDDLNETIRRASPALRETDKVLDVLATPEPGAEEPDEQRRRRDRRPRRQQEDVGRFVKETEDVATTPPSAAATSPPACSGSRPSCASCGRRWPSSAPRRRLHPYLRDLNASAGQLTRFLDNLGPFAESSRVNVRTLAKTADKARPAIASARPTVAELTKTTEHAPELANNLAIVLKDLDDRNRAVEKDKRSPGGQGYTGFEAVLQYIFDQMQAINIYDENGHILKVNLSPRSAATTRTPTPSSARSSRSRASSAAASPASARTSPACTTGRPDRHRRRRLPARPSPAHLPRRRRAGPRRTRSKDEEQERARPAGPARRRSRSCSRAAGGGNKPSVPSLPNVKVPNVPLPKVPARRSPASRTARAASPRRRIPRPSSTTSEPMRGRAASSVFANPVLVGAVTVLIVIVAVFLSYNANQGCRSSRRRR
jgi:hypothetical protein